MLMDTALDANEGLEFDDFMRLVGTRNSPTGSSCGSLDLYDSRMDLLDHEPYQPGLGTVMDADDAEA
eukprot:gene12359-15540_t